ncbi:outer membrane protein/peptidoglycan-associated (lipo)protein [Beggiatoa alba B18LD]|uniref:Outer membrane protein/peptidoglycan-associated (Lipo)protein n=1 Tax=Beggiatoa alba B18LD TaxID=395493 RepID=I3CDE4_9GAMM|nr:OmpA family protein [Beggiatoa alba]EIJ41637.1 outer membrane protein/peptidoglycan-associated (lipo)protein [Beggiatoa alba B18LD]
MLKINRSTLLVKPLVGAVMLALAGCGGVAEKDSILADARSAYMQAKGNSDVAKLAQLELYDAEKALQKAESADNATDMKQLAYLAKRQSEIALALGEAKVAKAEVDKLSGAKSDVVISSREKEAEKARLAAEAKAQEAEAAKKRLEAEMERTKALQAQLSELQGKQTDKGLVLTLGDVLFETNKAELMAGGLSNIDKIAVFLQQNTDRNILVEGHTDSVGSDQYNLTLSERRADSVRFALIQRGVASNRILARGFGKTRPVASNDTATGRQQNRRVEITILNAGEVLR